VHDLQGVGWKAIKAPHHACPQKGQVSSWHFACNNAGALTCPQVPIALVSLVDKDRQWFKSVQGLQTDNTDRQSSFCAWTLLPEHPEILVVEDATQDARFSQNKLVVGTWHFRAGVYVA
jgi:GAF domain-containing protein